MTKTIIVTGGNTGMGYETARALAQSGFQVIIACRSHESGQAAAREIGATCLPLDLASLESVRQCAGQIQFPLHGLICNAGIMTPPHRLTNDGFESQFQVNYLGHYLLTRLLLPRLMQDSSPRVINISSLSAEKGAITTPEQFQRIARQPAEGYSAITSYRESKLAQVLFTRELAQRGPSLFSAAVHPGVVNTDLFYRNMPGWAKTIISPFAQLGYLTGVLRTPARGAETAIYLAQTANLPSGCYWTDKKERASTVNMQNNELARALWNLSADLTGLARD